MIAFLHIFIEVIMRFTSLLLGVSISALGASTILYSSSAWAEEQVTTMEEVVVTGSQDTGGTLTVPSNEEAKEIIERTAGGVGLVTSEEFEDSYSLNFEDTLQFVPGVYAQQRYGEEVRLSIRGSGISRGFHLRGLTLLQDGVPYNLADGGADFQEADSLAMQRLEVYKGANALQYGSATLGGAINMVSKTGVSHEGNEVRAEVGSNNTYRLNLQSGQVGDDYDAFTSITTTSSEGYRNHSEQQNVKLNTNVGLDVNEDVQTRFYLSGNIIDQDLPGTVRLRTALDDNQAANNAAIASDWQRDIRSIRLANKTTIAVGDDDVLNVGAFLNGKDLFHPITPFVGVIDQESIDYGAFMNGAGEYNLGDYRNRYSMGITSHFGTVDAKVYQNIRGNRGALTADAEQDSGNLAIYAENQFFVHPEWALVTGAQALWADREVTDNLRPARSDSDSYTALNPKLGILHEPDEHTQFFANVSRSYEPPTFAELTQGGASGFTPVDAQRAWTAEIGSRGDRETYAWNVSLYRAWLDKEMLQFTTGGNIPASTFNAGDTVHQGLELGLDFKLGKQLFSADDAVLWRNAYTYSDFFFEDDVQFNDNQIAGLPEHFYQSELRYDYDDNWHAAFDWEFASDSHVDFANTLQAPGYGVFGFNAGYDITDSLGLYLDVRNIMDEEYISTYSTLAAATPRNNDVFYPAEGRRIFAGMRIAF
jgi:iron complex outermembrane recepter protein